MAKPIDKYSYYDNLLDSFGSQENLSDDSIAKLQVTGDYLDQESNYDNNLFDPSSYYDALIEKNTEYKTPKEDKDLYGFIPGNWLPDWVKAGYNQSITGLAEQVARGEQRFDLSKYNPSILEDVGATVISFLQPLDVATMIGTGGVGGLAAKAATKSAVKKAIQQGVGKGTAVSDDLIKSIIGKNADEAKKRLLLNKVPLKTAESVIEKATPRVLNQAFQAAAIGGSQLGFYSGLQSSLGQIADPEQEFELLMNIKNASKGAVLGATTGALGPIVQSATKNLNRVTQVAATKAAQTTDFAVVAPLLEGELPTPEDFAHAAGVIGALGAQRYATGKLIKGYKNIRNAKKDVKLTPEEGADIFGAIETAKVEAREVFTSRDGLKVKNVRFEKGLVKAQDEKTNKELGPYKPSEFINRGFSRSGNYSKDQLIKKREKAIFGIKSELKMDDSTFANRASVIVGETIKAKNPKRIVKDMTPIDQLKMLNKMRHEARTIKIRDRLKNNGWETTMIPNKTLSDYHKIKFLDRSKKRLQTQLSTEVEKRVDLADSRYFTLMGEIDQKFVRAGLYSRGMGKIKETLSPKTKEKALEEAVDLGRKLQSPEGIKDKKVKKFRRILKDMWDIADKAGVNLGPKEELYFPRIIKQDYLKALSNDIAKLRDKNPQLFTDTAMYNKPEFQKVVADIVSQGKMSSKSLDAIYALAGVQRKKSRGEVPDFNLKIAKSFQRLNTAVNVQYHNIAKNLEIARTAKDLPEIMLETDARVVLSKYAHQWARRVSSVEQFGNQGEFWKASISKLNKLASNPEGRFSEKQKKVFSEEASVLDRLYKIYTNNIELDPSYNWKSATARRVWSDVVDFEIGTKIGLGFATVPNITQISISTAVKTGYYPVIKGIYKLSTSAEYRRLIAKSGVSNISIYQSLAGLNPNDNFMGKFAEGATTLSGFQKINQINQLVSAAAAKEWIKLLQPVAQGKGTGIFKARQNWARQNLRDLGLTNVDKISDRQLSESMYRFARDTQLQRNVLEEPLVFNDPRFRPLFLFKKFGYKQFNWVRDQLGSELRRGNVFPMLRLASAGLFGGEFVSYSRDWLAELYAGKEVYDENEYFLNFGNLKDVSLGDKPIDSLVKVDRMTWGDVLDRFASVGSFGVVMDIVAAENTIRALEFAGKPAVVQDLDKIWTAMTRTWENIADYGGLGALQRMPKYIAPVLGTVPRRLAERVEPAGQRKTYVKYRKGLTRSRILDHLIEGDSIRATRLITNWNRSFPENPILYDDISIDEITKRIINKAKKRANP